MTRWLLLVLFLGACNPAENHKSKYSLSPTLADSIVGGTEIAAHDPLNKKVLSLQALSNRQETRIGNTRQISWNATQCTAAAIAPRIILTAAHCISVDAEAHRITIPKDDGKVQHIHAVNVIIHQDYQGNKEKEIAGDYRADLALLLLETALPEDIQILQLPPLNMPMTFEKIQAAGFGITHGRKKDPAQDSGVLRAVELNVLDFDPKSPTIEVDQTTGHGICQGDSGGPAMLNIENETYLVGVARMVVYLEENEATLDKCRYRGQYTNVQYYLNWITSSMEILAQQ